MKWIKNLKENGVNQGKNRPKLVWINGLLGFRIFRNSDSKKLEEPYLGRKSELLGYSEVS